MLQRHILYVAKTKFICCKDRMYMLQRQNVYVIKPNVYVTERNMYVIKIQRMCYKDKFICYTNKIVCYRDKICMSQRQYLYVTKTKFICCKDKRLGARCERSRRGFFSPQKRHSYFLRDIIAVSVL